MDFASMHITYKTKASVLDTLTIDRTNRRVLVAGGESTDFTDDRHQAAGDQLAREVHRRPEEVFGQTDQSECEMHTMAN